MGLIQIATQVFPFSEIPNWAVPLVVLAILIGFLLFEGSIFHCRLRLLHQNNGRHQNKGRDDLVRVEGGVKKAPGDADRGESLHHFEVAGRGCAG